jgi:hypothetical protein
VAPQAILRRDAVAVFDAMAAQQKRPQDEPAAEVCFPEGNTPRNRGATKREEANFAMQHLMLRRRMIKD